MNNYQLAYQLMFILTGVFVTSFRIAKSGILVEISNNDNRATYTGISGAGSVLPAVFPPVAGVLISVIGCNATFVMVSGIVTASFVFIRKLNCK